MRIYPHLTGIATLLIGLQLFMPKIVAAKAQPSLPNNISAEKLLVASHGINSPILTQITQARRDFVPPDNGGPDSTQGSGTR